MKLTFKRRGGEAEGWDYKSKEKNKTNKNRANMLQLAGNILQVFQVPPRAQNKRTLAGSETKCGAHA